MSDRRTRRQHDEFGRNDDDQARSRYDRSRYGTSRVVSDSGPNAGAEPEVGPRPGSTTRSRSGSSLGGSPGPAARYRDTFYEDMRIEEQSALAPTPAERRSGSGQRETNLWEMAGASRSRYSSRYVSAKANETESPAEPSASAPAQDNRPTGGFERYSRKSYARRDNVGRPSASGASDTAPAPSPEDASTAQSTPSTTKPAPQLKSTPKPKPKRRRVLYALLGVVAAVLLVGAGVAFAYVNNIASNLQKGVDQDLRNALVATDMGREPFYMLLLGTDGSAERDAAGDFGGTYRSDSMMLARIDAPAKKVTLISINRDTAVDLGEYGRQKINAAYGIGGPALAVEAVSTLLGVEISHYAQVDFDAFSALVDALGGVEVDVPIEIDDPLAGGYVAAGVQTLDGSEALVLCRSREAYASAAHPDEMRAANQRLVISAIAHKLLASDIATIASTVSAVASYVTTDLGINDIIGLAQLMRGLDSASDIYTAMIPTTSQYLDDVWYEFLDKKAWDEMRARIDAGEPPTEGAIIDETTGTVLATAGAQAQDLSPKYATVTVKNGTQRPGLAASARSTLMDAGFVNVIIGDIAEGYAYPETLVVYDLAEQAYEAEQIASALGQGETYLNDGSYLLVDTDFTVIIGDDWKSPTS